MKVKAKARIIMSFFFLIASLYAVCYLDTVQANTVQKDIRLDRGDTSGNGNSRDAQISSDGNGHVYAVWEDGRNGRSDIYFNYSEDNGVTWQVSDIRLDTGDIQGASSSYDPQVNSGSNGYVYVVWRDDRNGISHKYFNYSADNGVTWQASDIRLDRNNTQSRSFIANHDPQLSSDGNGHVYVVWDDFRNGGINNIYFNYSADNGMTWQANDVRLDTGDSPNGTNLPQISGDSNGHVYVVWNAFRDGDWDIYFNYSADNGVTWQTNDLRLDTGDAPGASSSGVPQLSSDDNGHVYAVWDDSRNGRSDIYFNYSADSGVTWQTSDMRLDTGDSPGASSSSFPQLSSDGNGYVYVVWHDNRNGKTDIYFNYSKDNGMTWQITDTRLDTGDSPGVNGSRNPQLSSDSNGCVYVVWDDERNGNKEDIYFNHSSDNGVTWQKNDIRLDKDTPGTNSSFDPQLSNDNNGNVYVIWNDKRNAQDDSRFSLSNSIYFNNFFIDKIVEVNNFVNVNPITSTYHQTSDTTDCPDGFVGKFGFDVEIKNTSNVLLSDLEIKIVELTGGNVLRIAEGDPGSEGATMAIPETGDYSDGKLDPGEYVMVQFVVCLKELKPFELLVDVLGKPGS